MTPFDLYALGAVTLLLIALDGVRCLREDLADARREADAAQARAQHWFDEARRLTPIRTPFGDTARWGLPSDFYSKVVDET